MDEERAMWVDHLNKAVTITLTNHLPAPVSTLISTLSSALVRACEGDGDRDGDPEGGRHRHTDAEVLCLVERLSRSGFGENRQTKMVSIAWVSE